MDSCQHSVINPSAIKFRFIKSRSLLSVVPLPSNPESSNPSVGHRISSHQNLKSSVMNPSVITSQVLPPLVHTPTATAASNESSNSGTVKLSPRLSNCVVTWFLKQTAFATRAVTFQFMCNISWKKAVSKKERAEVYKDNCGKLLLLWGPLSLLIDIGERTRKEQGEEG